MKAGEIKKASKTLDDLAAKYKIVYTSTNFKGRWTFRVTKRNVQFMLVTGDDLLDAMMKCVEALKVKVSKL